MATQQSLLRSASISYRDDLRASDSSLRGSKRIFLSHSHTDRMLAKGLARLMRNNGMSVYIDWMDEAMPDSPSVTTGLRIKQKILSCDFFLFLSTANSRASRWCPWEIGIADGVKPNDHIMVIPTQDDYGCVFGNEYLQLYKEVEFDEIGRLVLQSGHCGLPLEIRIPGSVVIFTE